MSGPKVVRIVTREELIERCEGLLARLDSVVDHWTAMCDRNGTLVETDVEQVQKTRRRLRALLETDQFKKLQIEVPKEISFLNTDRERRLREAAEAAASEKGRRRRLRMTAESLLSSFRGQSVEPPVEIVDALESVRSGSVEDLGQVERVVSRAVAQLSASPRGESLSDTQRKLATVLGEGLEGATFESWLAEHGTQLDQRLRRIDGFIGELELRDGIDAARAFVKRAAAISVEPSLERRRLLADSLVMDLAARARDARVNEEIIDEVVAARGELERIGGARASELAEQMAGAIESRAFDDMRELMDAGREFVGQHRQRIAAESRRFAVLNALQSFGYELREGMETAAPENGRLVLRSTGNPEYGVELSAPGNSDRIQVRPVAFRSESESSTEGSDLEFETRWCGDFAEVRQMISSLGGDCEMEHATPVGVVPLKLVEEAGDRDRRAEIVDRTTKRTLNR